MSGTKRYMKLLEDLVERERRQESQQSPSVVEAAAASLNPADAAAMGAFPEEVRELATASSSRRLEVVQGLMARIRAQEARDRAVYGDRPPPQGNPGRTIAASASLEARSSGTAGGRTRRPAFLDIDSGEVEGADGRRLGHLAPVSSRDDAPAVRYLNPGDTFTVIPGEAPRSFTVGPHAGDVREATTRVGEGLGRLVPLVHPRQQLLSAHAAVEQAKAQNVKPFVVTCPNCRGPRPPRRVLCAYRVGGEWVLSAHQRYIAGWQWVPKWLSELSDGTVLDVGHCGDPVDLTRAQISVGLRSGPRRIAADKLQAGSVG